jgi:hypothetical protein
MYIHTVDLGYLETADLGWLETVDLSWPGADWRRRIWAKLRLLPETKLHFTDVKRLHIKLNLQLSDPNWFSESEENTAI